jgi:putative ABC transport system permease protein
MQLFRVLRRWQKRTRALVHTEAVDQELHEEMAHHLELETKKNISLGMKPDEARRQARIAFGAGEQYRIETREARWWSWFPDLSLDFKLGSRMLVKHPALTVIATIAVAYAIAVGSVGFEIARQALWPTIPLAEGNAIVSLRNWNVADNESVRASRRDYELWRDGLSTITDLSAVEVEERSIAVGAGPGQPETVANVTASTFALTRVPALMGRTLLDADERSAEEVVVVGYDFWKNKLDGAADAVGRVIRISGTPVTIVGVMPRGYGFPQRNGVWRPLHLERIPEASPSLRYVFGRLAPGRPREEATAQVATIGARAAAMFPETRKNVRLQVLSLPDAVSDLPEAAALVLASMNVFLVLLGALLCANVAMLLFARAVSRERELLVRAALGASRGRLIMQFFAEALLLCAVGAVVGLMVARFVLARTWTMVEGQMGPLPFYVDTSLSTTTILYAALLTLLAAAIAGVVPAVKVTSGGAGSTLRAASSGGGGLQFGGVWTVVIVVQIAFTTLLPWPLLGLGGDFGGDTPAGFPAEAFLTATLEIDRFDGVAASGDTVPAMRAVRLEARYRALVDRLLQDPGVLDVTYADQMPQLTTSNFRAIEMDPGPAAAPSEGCGGCDYAKVVSVDPRFFDVVGAPVIRGRALMRADAEQRTRAVLVNEVFVAQVLGGRNPIGRRFRFSQTSEPTAESWHEIVGVVPDLSVSDNGTPYGRRIYQATRPRETGPLRVAIHVRGDPQRFAGRLRELAQATDPALRVIDPKPLPLLASPSSAGMSYGFELMVSLTLVTLMLSLAGVYAVTAFAVARRTREIGVRTALGAQPLHVLTIVFKRPFVQMALGIGVGTILGFGLANDDLSRVHLDVLGDAAVFALSTILCCALACIVPTRRALRIQPTEALKDES